MNDEVVPIGSVTFFVNVPKGDTLADEEQDYLAGRTVSWFQEQLQHGEYGNAIVVTSFSRRQGCLIIPITLGLVVTVIGGIGTCIIKYPDLRKGIIAIAEDVNKLKVKLKRWREAGSVCVMREDLEHTLSQGQRAQHWK